MKDKRSIMFYFLILISVIVLAYYIDNNAYVNKGSSPQQTESGENLEDGEDFSITSGGAPASVPEPPVNLITSCTKTNLFEYLSGKGGVPIMQTSRNLATYDGSVIAFISSSDSSNLDNKIHVVFPGPDKQLGTSDDGNPVKINPKSTNTNAQIESLSLYKNTLTWTEITNGFFRRIYTCPDVKKDLTNCNEVEFSFSNAIRQLDYFSVATDTHLVVSGYLRGTGNTIFICTFKKGCNSNNPNEFRQILTLDQTYPNREYIIDLAITEEYVYVVTMNPYNFQSWQNKVYIYEISTGKLNTGFDSTKPYVAISNIDAGKTFKPQIDSLFYLYYDSQYYNSRLSYILPGGIPDAFPGRTLVGPYTSINGISRNLPYTYSYNYITYFNRRYEYIMRIISQNPNNFIDIPLSQINEKYIHELQLASPNSFVYMQLNTNSYNIPFYVTCS